MPNKTKTKKVTTEAKLKTKETSPKKISVLKVKLNITGLDKKSLKGLQLGLSALVKKTNVTIISVKRKEKKAK